MKPLRIVSLVASLGLSLSMAFAQESTPGKDGMTEKPAAMQQGAGSSGTAQDGGMGATGWSGPHRGQTSPGQSGGPAPSDSPDKQPAVATGSDLNGPPKAFPSNKSPE